VSTEHTQYIGKADLSVKVSVNNQNYQEEYNGRRLIDQTLVRHEQHATSVVENIHTNLHAPLRENAVIM